MTYDEALKLGPDGWRHIPWNAPGFIVCPGRDYLGMFHIRMPKGPGFGPHGGDMTGLLWRFDTDADLWTLTYRFRYYKVPDDPNSNDKKSWYVLRMTSSDLPALRKDVRDAIASLSGIVTVVEKGPAPWQWLEVSGDDNKFWQVIEDKKPDWFHVTVTHDFPEPVKTTKANET